MGARCRCLYQKDIVLEKLRYHAEGNTPPAPIVLPCVEADARAGPPGGGGGAIWSSMPIFLHTTFNVLSTFLRTPRCLLVHHHYLVPHHSGRTFRVRRGAGSCRHSISRSTGRRQGQLSGHLWRNYPATAGAAYSPYSFSCRQWWGRVGQGQHRHRGGESGKQGQRMPESRCSVDGMTWARRIYRVCVCVCVEGGLSRSAT
jgi:hypothetical protein